MDGDDAGLDPAAGRVPTHHLGQRRADSRARVCAGRHAVLSVRLRTDVSGLLGDPGGPTAVRRVTTQRPATGAADTDSTAHAGLRPDYFLRCRAFGYYELFECHAARSVGGLQREHHQRKLSAY